MQGAWERKVNNSQEKQKAPGTQRGLFIFIFFKDSDVGSRVGPLPWSGVLSDCERGPEGYMAPDMETPGARMVGGAWDGLRSHSDKGNS